MRFVTTSRSKIVRKSDKKLTSDALRLLDLDSFNLPVDEARRLLLSLHEKFTATPTTYPDDVIYLNGIAFAYSFLFVQLTDWKFGSLIVSERDKYSDVPILSSPDNAYVFPPIGMIHKAAKGNSYILRDLLERVQSSALPPSSPDAFLDIFTHFYSPEDKEISPSDSFLPIEGEELVEWRAFAKSGAARFGVPLDENLFPAPSAVESIIKQIETEVFSRRGNFDFFKEQDYLKTLAALYGQCLKAGTDWDLAITWDETGEGFEGMPVLHSPDKLHWISPYAVIYRELTSKRKKPKLLRYYHLIKENKFTADDGQTTSKEIP
ncbi:MAG: hypothetical protein LBR07_01805 [Puniceicoccales bacterium]|jgi:hypothetical protein|nr:hypothetical protein [Puniceicoccales bacterium]